MVFDTTVYDVLISLVAAIPAILAAVFAGVVALRTKTRNGNTLGQLAESTAAHVSDNNVKLTKMTDDLEAAKQEGP